MKKKQYKVKIENGNIIPLESIEVDQVKEGIVIFFDEDEIIDSQTKKPVWEAFEEIMQDVPEQELKKLPKDGALEHDHYIYGTPKKNKK